MGRIIGLLASLSAMGTATGPLIGGFLIGEFGWRSVFSVMTTAGIFTLLLAFKFVQLSRDSVKSVHQSSFLDSVKSFLSEASFSVHLFSNLAISAVMISTLVVGPFYLTNALRLGPRHLGLVMSAGPITSILSGTLAGYAVDRLGSRFVIKLGLMLSLAGTTFFIFLPGQLGALGFALSAMLLSLGYQFFLSANSNSFMKNARNEHRGIAAGALNLSRNLGLISGTYLMGGLFDHFAKGTSLSQGAEPTISNGFQVTFTIAALLIAILLVNQIKHQKRRSCGKRLVN